MDSSSRSSVVGGGGGGATKQRRRRSSLIVLQQQQQQVHSLRSSFSSSRASATLLRSSVLLPPEVALFDLDKKVIDNNSPSSSTETKKDETKLLSYTLLRRFLGIFSRRQHDVSILYFLFQCWRFILAISGLLDFMASIIAPMIILQQEMMMEEKQQQTGQQHDQEDLMNNIRSSLTGRIFQVLHDYDAPIAGFFHVIWMVDGFVVGYHLCKEAMLENDRERLLLGSNNDNSGSNHSQSRKSHCPWSSPQAIYVTKIICQLALLPIGFYTRVMNFVLTMLDKRQQFTNAIVFQFEDNLHKSVKVSLPHVIDSVVAEEHERFTVNSKSSTAIVLLRQMFKIVSKTLHFEATNAMRHKIRRIIPKVIRIGIRHPIQSIRDAKSILRYIRYLKFLFPLILAQNRLLRYLGSFLKRLILKVLKPNREEMHDDNKDSQAESKIRPPTPQPKRPSILEVTESQRRIRKEKELQELIVIENQPVMHWQESDRRTLYRLHRELSEEASSWINQRLLMNPHSNFIKRWRMIFIFCALFEITMTTRTMLVGGHNNNKQPPLPPEYHRSTINNYMRPSHVSLWKVCRPNKPRKENLPVLLRRWVQQVTKRRKKNIRPSNATTEQTTGVLSKMTPWYCQEPYPSIQDTVQTIVGFIVYHMMTLVSIVCIADMYVTFFTGRFDPTSGSLVVKNKLQRWIVPGILSQLLVNPKLEGIAILASQIMTIGGPVRIWRWFVVIFFPVLHGLYELFEQRIWLPLVARHNQIDFELDDVVADIVFVEDASDSELEDDDDSSAIAARNLRPSHGQWMEPVDN